LRCWILNETGAQIYLGDDPSDPDWGACIAGDPGVRAGIQKDVDARITHMINIPLFDYYPCSSENTCPGTSVHVVDFGCVEVLGWEHSLTLPRLEAAGPGPPWEWKGKAIRVKMCGDCTTNCGGSSGGPIDPAGVRAVSLIR
jgi:hypothetical protein